jgi:hypothetical protein
MKMNLLYIFCCVLCFVKIFQALGASYKKINYKNAILNVNNDTCIHFYKIIRGFLLDKLSIFKNLNFKFTNLFFKYFNVCMFMIGFLIKFIFINIFSVNIRDINNLFISYAESIINNPVEKIELSSVNLEQTIIDSDQEVNF